MRSPFTGVIFIVELTHDMNVLLPLLLASVIAHAFTVLTLRRSILTEKISRRGFHLSREYAIDPLEILFGREVMRTNVAVFRSGTFVKDLSMSLHGDGKRTQRIYPVLDDEGLLAGTVSKEDLHTMTSESDDRIDSRRLADIMTPQFPVAYPDEPLRVVVHRMAETRTTVFVVVDRGNPGRLLGVINLDDLLQARAQNIEEERHRERVLRIRLPFRPARTCPV